MKKTLLLLFAVLSLALVSCSDDDDKDSKFAYPLENLYGTWDVTEIYDGSGWVNITHPYFQKYAMSISFKSDGSYYGKGYLGNGSGTYTAEGKTIITYVDGKEYLRYEVKSLSGNEAELSMMAGDSSMDVKAKKK